MKTLIVYDSAFGNTEKIAQAIAAGIPGARVMRAATALIDEVKGLDLLVVGSPTQGGRPTKRVQDFVNRLPGSTGDTTRIAAFDTRMSMKLARMFGYAAVRIADSLEKAGTPLATPPEGFIVQGRNGPLENGEPDRATAWGRALAGS